eukprot:CAMPEP_0115761144 /NCGR_PEP_ID=MMETSP0272-20121206/100356_1 /TAXON_ID=71861 /ORGANISM="Scrippsiella trochoidea, Strain CCMP3099" /LENGTH=211 /DNA_ID=CAMNT_0003206817 /DNA_START=35 /DNA_END=667 /DNA_ORIENTATION=+
MDKRVEEFFCSHETPAAIYRGNASSPKGIARPSSTFYNKDGNLIGGKMLDLTPSQDDVRTMEAMLQEPTDKPSTMPEQDFLTEFYLGKWVKLPIRWNYQLHQLHHLRKQFDSHELPERRIPFGDIGIIHFSGNYGPTTYLFDQEGCASPDQWIHDKLVPKYGQVDDSDVWTLRACLGEWFRHWALVQDDIRWQGQLRTQRLLPPLGGAQKR